MSTLFEDIFERSPVAMLLVDARGEIVHVNRHAETLFEFKRSELIGQPIEVLIPEGAESEHPALVQAYIEDPSPRQMGQGRDLFGMRKDGTLVPVEVGLNPLQNDGETMVLASVIDITERLRADERFRAAVDAAPNGMLMCNPAGSIVLCNRQMEEIFGYGREELIGRPLEQLIPEGARDAHAQLFGDFLKDPMPRPMGAGRELYGRHKSGQLIPVEIGLQPIRSGDAPFVISSVVDITQRRRDEDEIQRKTDEIEEFAYRASHDLRSPLKSIVGMADCVTEDIDDGDREGAKSGVDKISSLARRLLTLTDDLLALTQVDAAAEPVSTFDFEDYLASTRGKYHAELEETATEIQGGFDHSQGLRTQVTRLTQVLDNLVGNAIKYGDAAKASRFVRLVTSNTGTHFSIDVEDNGLGIPASSHSSVFGMFKRFHNTSVPGIWLGLYIVKKQVIQLGGTIEFESGAGGTTFRLRLPLVRA